MDRNVGAARAVGVFCGARDGADPVHREAAVVLGKGLADAGVRVVFGAGHVGLMGALADAALARGGDVAGVIPRDLVERELAHAGVATLHVVDGMHERKALMGALSDAFVTLPGGFGTLEETFEVLTWAQLGFHAKPCWIVDVDGFFASLAAHLDRAVEAGFLGREHRALARFVPTPEQALEEVCDYLAAASSRRNT